MKKYLYFGTIRIPTYSIMIFLGVFLCNCIVKRKGFWHYKEFCTLEVCGGLSAIVGAKLFSYIETVLIDDSIWESGKSHEVGYSFYGGMFGFFVANYFVCKIIKINAEKHINCELYLLPLLHVFWKVGCFFSGCCYGVRYNGLFSICYPVGINDISGVNVFPVQILEAINSLIIALVIKCRLNHKKGNELLGLYFLMYGGTRFFIEFLRFHENDSLLSVAHLYSLMTVGAGCLLIKNGRLCYERKRTENI